MASPLTPVGVLVTGAGVSLLWAAFTGQNPIDELRKALSTGQVDGAPVDGRTIATASAGVSLLDEPGPVVGTGDWPDDPTNLVTIGQGGHRLAAPAAASFRQVEQTYGRAITVTDSYRSVESQRANWRRDPDRFGKPGNSAHGEGRAVDVNLGALGLNPRGSNPRDWTNDAGYRKLYEAFTRHGWCNYQITAGTANGRTPEPWHYSYQVCK